MIVVRIRVLAAETLSLLQAACDGNVGFTHIRPIIRSFGALFVVSMSGVLKKSKYR